MALISKTPDGIEFNDSSVQEQLIIEKYISAINKFGFNTLPITYGVNPSPDFGYFDLANRYWRASLCIYLSGGVHCFHERGVGFSEPWLFNARHSFELTLKGLKLFSVWLKSVSEHVETSGYVSSITRLRSSFSSSHSLSILYDDFKDSIQIALDAWNTEIFEEPPSIADFFLTAESERNLFELSELDPNSFSFRYPSLKNEQVDEIQKLDWKHDPTQLFPKSGLPKMAGYFFDPVKAVNSLHDLNTEFTKIVNLSNSIWDYLGDKQDYIRDSI